MGFRYRRGNVGHVATIPAPTDGFIKRYVTLRPAGSETPPRGANSWASYVAVQHLDDATLVLYSDVGHAFLFQHARAFTAQVTNFLAT